MSGLNETHDPGQRSWVAAANAQGADFPIQNLPYGVFSTGDAAPRCGVAIGDRILDLAAIEAAGLLRPAAGAVFDRPALNDFLALGPASLARDPPPALAAARARTRARCATMPRFAPEHWCRSPTRACTCRSSCAASPISTPRGTMPRTSAPCSAAATTRCRRTGCTCRSATTAAPRPWWSRASRSGGRGASSRVPATRRRALAPRPGSTSSSSSARSSASRARWDSRSPPPRPRRRSSATCS